MGGKILVVEDEPEMLGMVSGFLKDNGYEISEAEDGEAALALVESFSPELILMDIQLPKIDGWVVCHRLKTDIRYKNIPIILFSGMLAGDGAADQTVEKCDYLLAKPVKMENLLEKVRQFIRPS